MELPNTGPRRTFAAVSLPVAASVFMSKPNYRFFHRDHMLSCRPFELEDGRFQARVAIAAMGGLKTQTQRFLDLDTFDSHDAAVAFAHEAGIAWVDKHMPVVSNARN